MKIPVLKTNKVHKIKTNQLPNLPNKKQNNLDT